MGKQYLEAFYNRTKSTLDPINKNWELIFVDDNSPDGGWPSIQALAQSDPRLRGIRLSRNFGQHPAITAGIHAAKGEFLVVMDCDLQDRPEDIALLYHHAVDHGHKVVIAERESSGLGKRRTIGSRLFNKLLSWLSGLEVNQKIGNFRLFHREIADAYSQFGEQFRFFPALMAQIGFEPVKLLLPRDERAGSPSSYTFLKLINLALEAIIGYSEKPLKISAVIGCLMTIVSLFMGLYYLVGGLFGWFMVQGFATLSMLILGFGGFQIFIVSLIGLFVGQVLREAKNRPIYIIEESTF